MYQRQDLSGTTPTGADSFTDPEISRAKSEGASVVTSSGSHALQVNPSASSTGECDQSVTLSPNHA